ncbi:hypothetical protein [Peribacillus simplex]|uniref:hypothetical protein n=1 Tax=Peribacillus simplex TaxID=1478 RepID=UPI0036715CE3
MKKKLDKQRGARPPLVIEYLEKKHLKEKTIKGGTPAGSSAGAFTHGEKNPFFLDLEQASSLLDGCLMQPLKLTVVPSGKRHNLLSKYSTLVLKVGMLYFACFLLYLYLYLYLYNLPSAL